MIVVTPMTFFFWSCCWHWCCSCCRWCCCSCCWWCCCCSTWWWCSCLCCSWGCGERIQSLVTNLKLNILEYSWVLAWMNVQMYLYTVAFSCGHYGCCSSPLLVAFGNVVIPVAILHLLIEYQILITIHNVFVSHGALQI